LIVVTVIVSAGAAVSVVGSKHDLSAGGPGPIKSLAPGSGGTTEICVFCHTPHTGRLDAPLWNRTNPSGPYTIYASDVLSALSYTVEDPLLQAEAGYSIHVKTRICMSCHDGTIALGSLVNLPGGLSLPVQMQNAPGGLMPSSAAGYIGTDLRDDHPVAVKHLPAQDPELQGITGSNARVYTIAGGKVIPSQSNGDYVECTSCHDPHDNQFGNFLIDDNVGSKLCRSCHDKAGDDSVLANESVHSNPAYTNGYSPPTGGTPATLGGSVQTVKCMVCHFPHKSGVDSANPTAPSPGTGKYLTTFNGEQTCFNSTNRWSQATNVCHGSTATTTKNIQAEVAKGSAHHVGNYTAPATPHNILEGRSGYGWLAAGGNSWHVECDDCHNSHTAGRLLHTAGTNTLTSTVSIYGAGGTEPSWPVAWTAPNIYTYIEPIGALRVSGANLGVTKEYQICLRCHSSFAWGGGAIPQANMTDQAKEFNINNASYHPVAGQSPNTNPQQWVAGSGFGDASLMYCSDCHGNDTVSPAPQGPHGSTNASILVLPANGANYGTAGGFAAGAQQPGDLCFKCHPANIYNNPANGTSTTFSGFRVTGTNLNLHNQHAYRANAAGNTTTPNPLAYKCVNCHIRAPHGWKRKSLVVIRGDGAGEPWTNAYEAQGPNTAPTTAALLPASGGYNAAKGFDCTSTVNGCHQ
jgi:predicted CXXCH cytochrome family protein